MKENMDIPKRNLPKIYVIGIGGGGNNALNRMIASNTENVEFIAINTDLQVLESCKADRLLPIGQKLTNGFGAGADPSIGEAAAKESEDEIREMVSDADMVILTCGMGGGTGTGATPVIARICKESGILTIAVVTTPFSFESLPRNNASKSGIDELKKYIDTLLVIPNDKLLGLTDKPFFLDNAFATANTVLKYTIEGITNIIFNQGEINLDFNDLRTTLQDKGIGHLGIGTVNAEDSVLDAVKQAINSPLLDTSIANATNILINSSGRVNLMELSPALSHIRELAGENVNLIWGTVAAEDFDDEKIVITIIATGMMQSTQSAAQSTPLFSHTVLGNVDAGRGYNTKVGRTLPKQPDVIYPRQAARPKTSPTVNLDFLRPYIKAE